MGDRCWLWAPVDLQQAAKRLLNGRFDALDAVRGLVVLIQLEWQIVSVQATQARSSRSPVDIS